MQKCLWIQPALGIVLLGLISLSFLEYSEASGEPVLVQSDEKDVIQIKKPVIGWVEKVRVYPGALELKAKIDTGAKSSSINAPNATTFERDGKRWVSFKLVGPNKKKIQIEKPIHRTTLIKRKGADAHERVVIRMFVCLGKDLKEIDVNLADRTGFNYQVLIGRKDLAKTFKVDIDPSAKFTRAPRCPPLNATDTGLTDREE